MVEKREARLHCAQREMRSGGGFAWLPRRPAVGDSADALPQVQLLRYGHGFREIERRDGNDQTLPDSFKLFFGNRLTGVVLSRILTEDVHVRRTVRTGRYRIRPDKIALDSGVWHRVTSLLHRSDEKMVQVLFGPRYLHSWAGLMAGKDAANGSRQRKLPGRPRCDPSQ